MVVEQSVVVHNHSGLHARPAAEFVKAAKRFADTNVWVIKGEIVRDAKSILQVLTLGVTKGTNVTLRAEGPAEADAVQELVAFIESGLGEGE